MTNDANSEWKEVNSNVWKPQNPGDFIEGVLVDKEENVGSLKSCAYFIETAKKERFLVWGSAILDERLKFVQVGSLVKIEFVETRKNKAGQPLKIFKVYTREVKPVEVTSFGGGLFGLK